MQSLLDAFVPAIGLILFGQLCRRRAWFSPAFWADAERLVFYVFLPALLLVATATVELSRLPVAGLFGAVLVGLAAGTLACLALWPALRPDKAGWSSALQGGIRFNNLVGFALTAPLFGPEGVALAAVMVGLMVPPINVICVVAFAGAGLSGRRPGVWGMAMQVVRNPLILSCVGGLALNVLGIGLPAGVGPILRALGQGAVALGLMAVGAALTLGALTARPLLHLAVLGIKLVLVPAVVWGAGLVFGLSGAALSVAVLFMGLPTASSSYIMARQMGGDAPLMAALTTTEHLAAVLTLPVWIALLR
jgi:hypothetical protein